MPTLCEKLVKHLNLPHESLLHKNLCGWLRLDGYSQDSSQTITLYHNGSIRVGKKEYPANYPLRDFLSEMEETYTTVYKELKDIYGSLHDIKTRLNKISNGYEGNGWSQHFPEMMKTIVKGYATSVETIANGVNAIANHTPSYGPIEE